MICGPSGVGKSSLIACMNEIKEVYALAISYTTKELNPLQEVDGKDYYKISREEFLLKKERNEFAETNPYMEGDLYGTPWSEFERIKTLKLVPALDIDINGIIQLDQIIPRQKTFRIFLDVHKVEQINRLVKRGRDSPQKIFKRVSYAEKERELLEKMKQKDPQLFNAVVDYSNKDRYIFANQLLNTLILNLEILCD